MSSRLVCCLLLAACYITLVSSFSVELASPLVMPGPYSDVQVIWSHSNDTDQNNGVVVVLLGPSNYTQAKSIPPEEADNLHGEMTFQTKQAGAYQIFVNGPGNTVLAASSFQVVASQPTDTTTDHTNPPGPSSTAAPGGNVTTSKQTETSTSSTSETSTGTSSSPSGTSSIDTSSASQTNISAVPSSPSSLSPPPESSSAESESSQNHTPVIVGAVVGAVALLALVILAVIFIRRRKKRNRPVSFHREMMVRSPGPSLYPGSRATSPTGDGTMVTMPSSITDLLVQAGSMAASAPSASPSTAGSNPFKDSHEVIGNRMSEYDEGHQFGIAYQPHEGLPSPMNRPDSGSHHQKPSISSHVDS